MKTNKIKPGDIVYLNRKFYEVCSALGKRYSQPFDQKLVVDSIKDDVATIINEKNEKDDYHFNWLSHQNELVK